MKDDEFQHCEPDEESGETVSCFSVDDPDWFSEDSYNKWLEDKRAFMF